jgi:hypothetical protein
MWWLLILILVDMYLIWNIREPKNLTEVKKRYKVLRDYIKTEPSVPEKFHILKTPVLIAGKEAGELGYNSNKGYEIGLCLNGSTNDIFHVLLHELSHSTVEEYSHSEQFWKNFSELKEMCTSLGIYERIPERKAFCGQFIQD